jgi:putative lipase involved disintegration of autophagic bodies
MSEFAVSGKMKVKTVKENFKSTFGVGLRVYHGKKFADDEATIASIREKTGSEELKVNGHMLVGNMEELFKETFGIPVQVENAKGELADNSVSIASLKK